jgi:multisubunit Na+/H+ antiporter MnhF subunit
MIAIGLLWFLLGAIALASVRLFSGPTLYDRALAAHAIVLLAAMAAAAAAAAVRQAAWVDAAIALVIADFVLAAAMLKYFRFRSLQPPMTRIGAAEMEP